MAYETLKREHKYKGRIIEMVVDTIALPNGKTTEREIVLRGNAAAMVPIDENGNITLVEQYRCGAGKLMLEIPAGMVDKGEDMKMCAYRELAEECGLAAKYMTKLLDMHVSVGFCTEVITIFLAQGFTKCEQNFDDDEFIELFTFSTEDVVSMIMRGEITDSKTVAGVFAAIEYLKAHPVN